MNGRELSDALWAKGTGLQALFISGYASKVIAHHGVVDEGIELLEKPFRRDQLLTGKREVLASAKGSHP